MNPIHPADTLRNRVTEWQRSGCPVRVLLPFVPAVSHAAARDDHASATAVALFLGCLQEFEAEVEAELRGDVKPNSGRCRRSPDELLVDVHRIAALLDGPLPRDDVQPDDVAIVATSGRGEPFLLPIRTDADVVAL